MSKIPDDFAPKFRAETKRIGRQAAIIWAVFFLMWVVLLTLAWWLR